MKEYYIDILVDDEDGNNIMVIADSLEEDIVIAHSIIRKSSPNLKYVLDYDYSLKCE